MRGWVTAASARLAMNAPTNDLSITPEPVYRARRLLMQAGVLLPASGVAKRVIQAWGARPSLGELLCTILESCLVSKMGLQKLCQKKPTLGYPGRAG